VPEVILNAARIVPRIGQRIATGVAQHVDVDREPNRRLSRFTRRLTASVVNGPPRSVVNTKGDAGS
jgi:hypothetical protein